MPLTDTAIRNAKVGAKPAKLFDERGLFLIVTPAGVSGGDSATNGTPLLWEQLRLCATNL